MSEFQKIMALFTILATGIYGLIGWNLNISYEALKLANNAMRTAEAARPNPYTSVNATEDIKIHQEQHVRETETIKEDLEIQVKLINAELMREIERLPRPPPYWVKRIDGLVDRVKDLEIARVKDHKHSQ